MSRERRTVVGLDVGTTKICAIVAEIGDNGSVDITGIGTHPSRGLRKGVVINIESTIESIKRAIEEAELMAGSEITSVFVGIAGGHIKGFNSRGIVAIKDREVTQNDIDRVIEAAKAVAIPPDREVIHILPQEFIIDEQDGIKDPLGMLGVRLESNVHIVTGAVSSAQNLIKCANSTGLNVNDIVLEQLASSEAVLSDDEKELGVALIDIGGGTSDVAIFNGGCIKHTYVLSFGGNHITNDLALGLRTPTNDAEAIKIEHGNCMSSLITEEVEMDVPSVGGRKPRRLSNKILCDIIEPRVEEMFTLINHEIVNAGFEGMIGSGIVLTGGTSCLPGIVELAEQIFDLPVRRGIPTGIRGLTDIVVSPLYATGVGLVLYGSKHLSARRFRIRDENKFGKVAKRMKEWFGNFFL